MLPYAIIVMGASLGGLRAAQRILATLPPEFPVPIALVLHRKAGNNDNLRHLLQTECLAAVEILDKQVILPGCLYVAPSDYHTLIEGDHFALSSDEPVNCARPSIDVLFDSAADTFGARAVGVILTGMGADGACGLARIEACGGMAIVQNPETAHASALPKAALQAVPSAQVREIGEIAALLVETCGKERPTHE